MIIDSTTAEAWMLEANKLARIELDYDIRLVDNLTDDDGKPIGGRASIESRVIEIDSYRRSKKSFFSVYLHEVGHLIALQAGLDFSRIAQVHNRYFGLLIAIMYRRVDMFDCFQLYDCRDGFYAVNGEDIGLSPDDRLADGDELVNRLRYIIHRSAELASTMATIEELAARIYKEDCVPEWLAPAPQKSWWSLLFGQRELQAS